MSNKIQNPNVQKEGMNSDQKEKRMDHREITRRRLPAHGEQAMARQIESKKTRNNLWVPIQMYFTYMLSKFRVFVSGI